MRQKEPPPRGIAAAQLTINVIGLRVKGFSWTGEQSIIETKYLAEQNGGAYISVETEDELASAFEKTTSHEGRIRHFSVAVIRLQLPLSRITS
jgi:hypothetical protein